MLSNKQKRHLKALAHNLKPVVMLGNNGLTANVIAAIDEALQQHELIKVKLAGSERDERQELVTTICSASNAEAIGVIGATAIIYRKHLDKPKISLPKE